jgi:K+-sensing histidine kinase KdpD
MPSESDHADSSTTIRRCPVTKIDLDKPSRERTPRERRIRFHFHSIRIVALIHLLIAIGIPIYMQGYLPLLALIMFVIINLSIAVLLNRFSLLGYRIAVIYYFLFGMVSTLTIQRGTGEQLIGIILALLALYLIGNQTSKSLFDRSVDEI